MGGLVVSTFLTTVLLPTTATLSEDLFRFAGRMLALVLREARRLLGMQPAREQG
jgi:hypothetical protein